MSVSFRAPHDGAAPAECAGCKGDKKAPIAGEFSIGESLAFALCEECGRDTANVIGFACIRLGGWSKLEPRKRRGK